MTNEEFIAKATEIFNNHDVSAQICRQPDILYLGNFSYMTRTTLQAVARDILKLEFDIDKMKTDMQELLAYAENNDQCDDDDFDTMEEIAKRWSLKT